ncbi:MAG TPA: Hsp20/alpha crystallin family protein [Vicinamibacterales bacterium]|jgi:HSP20 family protein|nr:Hsp20/alpha crystallin family protein [Vicinamibacterales bacterium]
MKSMRQIDAMLPLAEVRDLADEVRRLFDDLDRARTLDRRLLPGVFSPTLDAQETPGAIEVVVDLPGVALDDIRILIKGCVVIIAGGKMPPNPGERAGASFHLVERDFGRFARAVRLTGAFHTARATATLANGELRVRVPKVEERRGRDIAVQVRRGPDA